MSRKLGYFTRKEWFAFWIATLISLTVYVYTLAPNVGLEDSGEFLTAAYAWGVPHPPGYPLWTISANLFERLIPYGNAAWRGNLLSAFYGALASGFLALATSRLAGRLMAMQRFRGLAMGGVSPENLALMAGVVAGLVFAFIGSTWSQAVIAEVYTLNSFFFSLLCLLVMRWFDAPRERRWPCLVSLVFALGITNHHILFVCAPAFLFAMRVIDRDLYRDVALPAAIGCAMLAWQSHLIFLCAFSVFYLADYAFLMGASPEAWTMRSLITAVFSVLLGLVMLTVFGRHEQSVFLFGTFFGGILCLVTIFLVIYGIVSDAGVMKTAGTFFLSFILFVMGSAVYAYMPASAFTNPPMNWGHVQSTEEFHHQVTRRQYEKFNTKREDWRVFILQLQQTLLDMKDNFSLPLILLGLLALVFFFEFPEREKFYVGFTFLCFVCMGPLLVWLLNSKFDVQSRYIIQVFYSLAHCVFALWVGIGALCLLYCAQQARGWALHLGFIFVTVLLGVVGMEFDAARWNWWNPVWLAAAAVFFLLLRLVVRGRGASGLAVGLMYLLPAVPLCTNWARCEMRGHDFGWRYGRDMLKDLDRDAVVFGGTDPGRFVPTYMIFVESVQPARWRQDPSFDRRDLYIITQNALADQTYMRYIRDHYDNSRPRMEKWYHKLLGRHELYPAEPLRLPSEDEFTAIFNQVVEATRNQPGGGVKLVRDPSGKVMQAQVEGLQGVFNINGAVARWIFDNNKDKHSFYVEESHPLYWMYDYLEPCGLIMKLHKEPLKKLDPGVVTRDLDHWKKLKNELMANPAFRRDVAARRSFSKLRSSLGGLYAHWKMWREAEIALKESLEFYPESGEGRIRLTEAYVEQDRLEEARAVCEEWMKLDPYSGGPPEGLARLDFLEKLKRKESDMASLYDFSKNDPSFIFQYLGVLRDRDKWPEADRVLDEFLAGRPVDLAVWQSAIQLYGEANRPDRIEAILTRLTERDSKNASAWYNLAVLQAMRGQGDPACTNLARAIKLDKNKIEEARQDVRFQGIQQMKQFQKLVK